MKKGNSSPNRIWKVNERNEKKKSFLRPQCKIAVKKEKWSITKELLVLFKSQTFLLFPQIDKSVLKCWSLGGCQESRLLKTPETASLNFLLNIPTWSDFAIGLVLLLTSLVFLSGCLILIVAILKSTLQGINHVYCLKNFLFYLANLAKSLSGLL